MQLALDQFLARLGYINEAEAAALLYRLLCDGSSPAGQDSEPVSIAEYAVERGARQHQLKRIAAEQAPSAAPVSIKLGTCASLFAQLLLRTPLERQPESLRSVESLLPELDRRWRADFGRPLMDEAADFLRENSGSSASLDSAQLELRLRRFARQCRRELPQHGPGAVLELLVDVLDLPALRGAVDAVLRVLLYRHEGRRQLAYLYRSPLAHRLMLYLRCGVYTAALILLANIPGCLRTLDTQVRHSWFVWRGERAPSPAAALVLLEDWRSTAHGRQRVVSALSDILSYEPAAVGIDIQLFDPYPEHDARLQALLAAHPEVVLVGAQHAAFLRPPPLEVTGLAFDPSTLDGARVASDVLHFTPQWYSYGGSDAYQLSYTQRREPRASLALLTAAGSSQLQPELRTALQADQLRPSHATLNYLGSLDSMLRSSAALTDDLLVDARDSSPEGLAFADICRAVLAQKVVLLGADTADQDRHATPFDPARGGTGIGAPGVLLHFFALNALLEPALRLHGTDSYAWWLCLAAFFVCILLLPLNYRWHPLLALLGAGLYYLAGLVALRWLGLYLPWQPLTLVILAAYPVLTLAATADRSHEAERLCGL